jgi:hypothetical protein
MRRATGKLRLSAKERGYMRDMTADVLDLRHDYPRRLHNALLCLAQSDPRWMIWLEKNFKPHQVIRLHDLLLIEARAHCIVLRAYGFFGRQSIGELILRHDWPFSDNGSLSPG